LSQVADILLLSGALGAALYCMILSHRLTRFTDLEKGVGGAVAVLSAQVDDLQRILSRSQAIASGSVSTLNEASERAEAAGKRIELLLASLHDLPEARSVHLPAVPTFVRHPRSVGRQS
jgi:hypothetical protein